MSFLTEPEWLLGQLKTVRWNVASKAIGNSHATLIGLLVEWWICLSPSHHLAFEGGPGYGRNTDGSRGQCDALLCKNGQPEGILEVEGTRYAYAAEKIGHFFSAQHVEFKTLRFAILVFYAYTPVGRGNDRCLRAVKEVAATAFDKARLVSSDYPDKAVAVISVDKRYERQRKCDGGFRWRNEYYWGTPNKIEGLLFRGGECFGPQVYWAADPGAPA